MHESKLSVTRDRCLTEGPQSVLEKKYIEEYLRTKGYCSGDLQHLPAEEAKQLMVEACTYASLRLAVVESRARFRDKIRFPTR